MCAVSSSAAQDALRSARLCFVDELSDGIISEGELASRTEVLQAFRARPVPRSRLRMAQRLEMKAGLLNFESGFLSSVLKARRAMLGVRAGGPPKFLVRVDEFPDAAGLDAPERGLDASKAFHETLAAEGVPYLMAIVPQYTHRPLDPAATGGRALDADDRAFIQRMSREGVTFAQHGTTHRTRYANPRHRSELCGLRSQELDTLIADGLERLAQADVFPRVFVPPFNRFDACQFSNLARHFDVIAGGPESVPLMGFHGGPLWREDAVFLPCYAPYYAQAAALPPVIDRVIGQAPGTWIPIVLHSAWEIGDGFRSLAALARKIAPYAASWDDFLQAVDASRSPISAQPAAATSRLAASG
jgi:Uncharacterized protein conserved in bacteria (DUF2334)